MYTIIFCLVFYLMMLFKIYRLSSRCANSFYYEDNFIFVSRNLLKPNSKMHKLYLSPNSFWNTHNIQNALMRLFAIIIFCISFISSIIALILYIVDNELYFIFDCLTLGLIGLNVLLDIALMAWIGIEGVRAKIANKKIPYEKYLTYKEKILNDYPNFWIPPKK